MSLWNKPMQSAGHIAVVMSCGGKTDRDDTGYAAGSEFSDLRYVFLTGESYGSSGNASRPRPAALGVLTPQPCTMVPAGTWIPTNPKIMVGGIPCLTNEATLLCGFGAGTIKMISPGQTKVLV